MSHKIKLTIPKPCHEKWEEMSNTEQGKFCSSCQKNVIDFTRATDKEIIKAFQQNNNICARFLKSDLNRNLILSSNKNSFWITLSAAIISFLGVGTQEIKAQESIKTEHTDKKFLKDSNNIITDEILISGVVRDKSGPLPGALIFIKGEKKSTQTNLEGEFKIVVKRKDKLTFSFTGYKSRIIKVSNDKPLDIKLDEASIELGSVVIEIEN